MRRVKNHTKEKLDYFRKYIEAYLVATKKLPIKYYIDAFAGTGKCVLCGESCSSRGGKRCVVCGKGKIIDGSALISLKTKNQFNGYVFIELDDRRINRLNKFIRAEVSEEILKKIATKKADSNLLLKNFHQFVSPYAGCLILLDPEGPELLWETIEYLSKIKKAELLILYPYDMSLVRLTKDYGDKLDRFYGTAEWSKIYNDKNNINADSTKNRLLEFYCGNLKKLGFEYVVYKQIRRKLRDGKPLYHFILATHHHAGEKIMKDIFNKELDGQTKMKF
ncbi:MAG: three-Cys-motif partner protein TcmP [Patescibacteria group bacterium]|jgi:three-Cys-motif partner protein